MTAFTKVEAMAREWGQQALFDLDLAPLSLVRQPGALRTCRYQGHTLVEFIPYERARWRPTVNLAANQLVLPLL